MDLKILCIKDNIKAFVLCHQQKINTQKGGDIFNNHWYWAHGAAEVIIRIYTRYTKKKSEIK